MAYGFGKKAVTNVSGTYGGSPSGYHDANGGYYAAPTHNYQNDVGEDVTLSSGLLRNADGSVHEAYDFAPGTGAGDAVKSGEDGTLSPEERMAIINRLRKAGFAASDAMGDEQLLAMSNQLVARSTAGLPSLNQLGGGSTKTGLSNSSKTYTGGFGYSARK